MPPPLRIRGDTPVTGAFAAAGSPCDLPILRSEPGAGAYQLGPASPLTQSIAGVTVRIDDRLLR